MKRLISIALCAFFFSPVFFAHRVYAQAPRKVKLTIPVETLTMMPVFVAQSRGYFNAKGEDPSIAEFPAQNLVTRPEVIEKDPR